MNSSGESASRGRTKSRDPRSPPRKRIPRRAPVALQLFAFGIVRSHWEPGCVSNRSRRVRLQVAVVKRFFDPDLGEKQRFSCGLTDPDDSCRSHWMRFGQSASDAPPPARRSRPLFDLYSQEKPLAARSDGSAGLTGFGCLSNLRSAPGAVPGAELGTIRTTDALHLLRHVLLSLRLSPGRVGRTRARGGGRIESRDIPRSSFRPSLAGGLFVCPELDFRRIR